MTKTKFLSKVLAVLMALSMLCSTGVFADYGTGDLAETTEDPAIITGTLTLNDRVNLFTATTAETAKWADVNEGIEIDIAGTVADATEGYVTYHLVETGKLNTEPLDLTAVEAATLAIGTITVGADGTFADTITVDSQYAANLAKDKTYEFRYAYSTTESTGTWVYVRYIRTFDWDAATYKATRTVNKPGIGDIEIEIQANPVRESYATNEKYLSSPTHIRSASLDNGDYLQYGGDTGTYRADSKFVDEDSVQRTSPFYTSMLLSVGTKLKGGVLLAHGGPESKYYVNDNETVSLDGNAAYRFQATASGTVYLLGNSVLNNNTGWTRVLNAKTVANSAPINYPYLYVTTEVTADMADTDADGAVSLTELQTYVSEHQDIVTQDPETAVGYYTGGGSSAKWKPASETFYQTNTAFFQPNGTDSPLVDMPQGYYDEEDTYLYESTADYGMVAILPYGWKDGRGYTGVTQQLGRVYTKTFEKGEWVEIPYMSSAAKEQGEAAVIQFDVPAPALTGASVTTTKSAVYADAALTTLTDAAVTFDGEYVIEVPRATATATFTITNAEGNSSEATEVTMDAPSKVVTVAIGDFEYDVTVKFDDEYPTLFNVASSANFYGSKQTSLTRFALQYGDLSSVKVSGAATNVATGTELSSLTFANGATKPEATKNLIAIGTAEANKGQSHMTGFNWKETTRNDGITFGVSHGATVYAMSHARGNVSWPTIEALGYDEVGTLDGQKLYAKHFAAGETVQIPTEPVTQAELDAYNTANASTTTKWAFVDDTNKTLELADGTAIPDGAAGLPIKWNIDTEGNLVSAVNNTGSNATRPVYYTREKNTVFYVEFDSPIALGEVTYSVDGGDAEAITFAEGETTANIELPYNATTVSVAATKTGTGSVTVSDALDLTNAASGTITVTVAAPTGDPVVYTINFVKGDPKITWESALALTGTPKTQTSTIANLYGTTGSIYGGGIYKVADQSGEIDLSATVVDLEVAYGTEAVVFNDDVSVDLLANNGTGTATVNVNGTDYTINVSWKAFDAAEMSEDAPLLYDLQYHVADKSNLAGGGTWYYAMPTRLTLDAEHDWEYGTVDLDGAEFVYKNNTYDSHYKANEWITVDSHDNTNYTVTNDGANIARLRIAGESFASWVETGDLKDKYALDGATVLVPHYKDAAKNTVVSPRYTFKSAVKGYVIAAFSTSQGTTLTDAGWVLLSDVEIKTSNKSDGGIEGSLDAGDAPVTSIGTISSTYDKVYIKQVDVGDTVEVLESAVADATPPLVIVATEDMINERIVTPTLLSSLSYTTGLYATAPSATKLNNDPEGETSYFAKGFYHPTLITEAATVEVAEDATTVTVTVPYGSEIVNLAGVDTYEGAVEFDAIDLINNNGSATVTKTVGDVEYTINVVWAAVDAEDGMGLPAGNMVYDFKYKLANLATATTHYNVIPMKFNFTGDRLAAEDYDLYKYDAYNQTYTAVEEAKANVWYDNDTVSDYQMLSYNTNGKPLGRTRFDVRLFENWTKAGYITVSGIPGEAMAAEATDAEVDAITAAAMNGAMYLAGVYNQQYVEDAEKTGDQGLPLTDKGNGVNADSANLYEFKVAQDSIVFVVSDGLNPGEGWTKLANKELNEFNRINAGTTTVDQVKYTHSFGSYIDEVYAETCTSYMTEDHNFVGAVVYYRYAKKGENVEVAIGDWDGNKAANAQVFVRAMDFSAIEAPTAELTYSTTNTIYKVGTVTDGALETKTQEVTVPWGTATASVEAVVTAGVGNATASEAVNLLTAENHTADVTVTVTDAFGEVNAAYTITFKWADPAFEGQYVTDLTKYETQYSDRIFVAYGEVDNASMVADKGYAAVSSEFFAADDVDFSSRVPEGLAERGKVAIIADAYANAGREHMAGSNFTYLYGDYPATNGADDAWLSFTIAKAGTVYVTAPQHDGTWPEIEQLGWTEAPFTFSYAGQDLKVYQKHFNAGATVYMPNAKITDTEIAAINAEIAEAGYYYDVVTADDITAMETAVKKKYGDACVVDGVVEGDYIAKYRDPENTAEDNIGGYFAKTQSAEKVQFRHYVRMITGNYYRNAFTFAVADDCVADELKAPTYTGASTMAADGTIELSATPAIYAEIFEGEFTYAIKEGPEYATLEGNVLTAIEENWVEGASVVITITQGDLTSKVTINILPVSELKYGYITITEPPGTGTVEGYVGEELVIDGSVTNAKFKAGTEITLIATPVGKSTFAYWKRVDTDSIYSRSSELTINVPYSIELTPVFRTEEEASAMVIVKGYQDKILDEFAISSLLEDTFTLPKAPEVFGYKFTGYEYDGITYDAEEPISKAMIAGVVTFEAIYEQDQVTTYAVTVEGGKLADGTTAGNFFYNDQVTVTADEVEGQPFKWWTVGGVVVSYDNPYTFHMASADRALVAVYAVEGETVVPAPVLTMTVAPVDETAEGGPIYALYAERRVPADYTVIENGIIYGADDYEVRNFTDATGTETPGDESDDLTLDTYTGKKTSNYQNNNGQYTIRIQMTENRKEKSNNWYARTYLIYKDTDGTVKTFYSAPTLIYTYPADSE